ncbi:class 1 fructose-bisphosphatase [Salinarchaeum sp. Harcht-Bsk1]|uniref:class 1 fructose-bisphosphatase n=1 Tax=Salinarchaeum sp. Harcht-Bsk1 TaxID=1333523 RepID=UPI000677790E|nr:class 1 fructose-bisphosphatase [Salinarchaeum sp. Harcht-Bsk1]
MSTVHADATVDEILEELLATAPELRSLQAARRGGETDEENPTGDELIAADAAADEHLVDALAAIDGVGTVASEERAELVDAGDGLSVTVDPLDGSSNLAANAPTGTILGVYDADLPAPGRSILASAMVVYGPVTTAYVAIEGEGVTEYELPPGDDAEPTVAEADVTIPNDPTIYGVGGGDDDWPEPVADVVDALREQHKLRYSGALVADVSQVLTSGGLFAYPQLESSPTGKLRHQFEVGPIAFLVESAGGASTDGNGSLLDRPAQELHGRSPIYVGSEAAIERVEAILGDRVE